MLEYLVLIPPLGNNNKKVTWYIDAILCPPIKKNPGFETNILSFT